MKKKGVNVKKYVKSANDVTKTVADNKYIFIALAIGIGGYYLFKKLKKGVETVTEVFKPIPTDDIKVNLKLNTNNLTITNEKAMQLSKALFDAFNYVNALWFEGTDEKQIEEVFKQIKTPEDYKLIYSTFGKRPYLLNGTPTNYIDKKFAEDRDLNYWLKAELNSVIDAKLYKIVKDRVNSAGFVF